jgi:hypothetical protein
MLRYNSAIFKTLGARQYSVFVVNDAFLKGAPFNDNLHSYAWFYEFDEYDMEQYSYTGMPKFYWSGTQPTVGQSPLKELQQSVNTLQRLSPSECIAAYATDFITNRGSLLAVTNSTFIEYASAVEVGATSNSSLYGWSQSSISITGIRIDEGTPPDTYTYAQPNEPIPMTDPLAWICAGIQGYTYKCNNTMAQSTLPNWSIFNYTIEYCLSQQKDDLCTLEFSLVIMIVTIIANAIKAICMAFSLISFGGESPLVTIGYAFSLALIIDMP